jgi:hypothetical protein
MHKDLAAGALRSPVVYVGDNRLAHVVWEGDMTCPVGLPGPKSKAPIGPIDIIKAQRDHVLRAETKTCKAEEDGAVAHTDSAVIVVHGQHPFHVLWGQT